MPSGVRSPPTLTPPSLAGRLFQTRLQRVAEGVVGREVVPLLAGVLDQRAGHRVGFHLRGVADAEHVPMAIGAGDRIGVAAGHDVEDLLLVRDVRHGQRQRRIDVAEQEVDFVAVDQLARLLHRGAGVAAGEVLDQELDLATEDAALGIDLFDGELAPISSFLPSAA